MLPPATVCHAAVRSRDRRFDGVFFTGVTSTGIYCRPVCPTRAPKVVNCRFFDTPTAAAQAGFRPCLRCRPELAPALYPEGDSALPAKLLRFLQAKALEGLDMPAIAQASGYSERQLRRLVTENFGVSPVEVMQNERLLFAKRLLHDTTLPIGEIALAAGFQSLRRFNHLFHQHLRLTPTAIRKRQDQIQQTDGSVLRLHLSYRPPLAWDDLLHWLAARATPGVEHVDDDGSYSRTVKLDGKSGWLTARLDDRRCAILVDVSSSLSSVLPAIQQRLRGLFDLDAMPDFIGGVFAADPLLGNLAEAFPGLRVPGAWDLFESAVRVILGQQVAVAAATTLAGRLNRRWGEPIASPLPSLTHIHVTPEVLAATPADQLAAIGLPGKRAETLRVIGRFAESGGLKLPPTLAYEEVIGRLTALPGIGPWTAHYLAMRALRYPDAFPAGDLGLRKALGQGTPVSERQAEALSQRWRPWRSYAAALLWHSLHPLPATNP